MRHAVSNALDIAPRWGAREVLIFSIDILLRWSKEVSLQMNISSRQRRGMSIEIRILQSRTPAECYVF